MSTILKNNKTRNLGILAAVLILGLVAWKLFGLAGSANATTNNGNEAAVSSIDLIETIEASGSLEAQPFASLNWKTDGIVESVNVQPGDFVNAGDALLTLQPESASASLVSAQADLETAQANLRALIAPDGSSVGSAIENASSAFEDWGNARVDLMDAVSYNKGGGDDDLYDDVVTARDDLVNAIEDYPLAANTPAQFYYWAARADSLGYTGDYDYAALKTSLRAELNKEDADYVDAILAAQVEFESLTKSFAGSMEDQDDAIDAMKAFGAYEQSADALLDALQAEYGVLIQPSTSDLISAQAKVDSAQANVNNLSIVAPFSGQVLSVDDRAGDTVTAGDLSVNIADLNNLYVETQVDESDIANVKLGNQAEVTLDAVSGVTFTGKVATINPVGVVVSGLVKYTVRIELDKVSEDAFLPLGTTANVVIKTRDAAATLTVPIAAIQNDTNGEYVWVIQADGSTMRVDVVSGSIVGDLVAVTGDLQDGDQLQLISDAGFQAPNPLSGGK